MEWEASASLSRRVLLTRRTLYPLMYIRHTLRLGSTKFISMPKTAAMPSVRQTVPRSSRLAPPTDPSRACATLAKATSRPTVDAILVSNRLLIPKVPSRGL